MGVYVKSGSFIDSFTDAGFLRERMPQLESGFDEAKLWREVSRETAKPSSWGTIQGGAGEMKHVASIPADIGLVMQDLEPDIFTNKTKFFAWLQKHPEYRAYD